MTGIIIENKKNIHDMIIHIINHCTDINRLLVMPNWREDYHSDTTDQSLYTLLETINRTYNDKNKIHVKCVDHTYWHIPPHTVTILDSVCKRFEYLFRKGCKLIITDDMFIDMCMGKYYLGTEILSTYDFIILCEDDIKKNDCLHYIQQLKSVGITIHGTVEKMD